MQALYRSGRQAEALEAYREARRVLQDELGLEPSEELRSLEQAILQHDEKLAARHDGAGERAPDRRTVTALFCDLVDSSRLAGELDPEVYRQVLSRYFDLAREAIERHGGTMEKFIGDAVMAVFGFPELHEDDALRAVRAAADVQAALEAEQWDVPLAARIGVSTGEVHVLSSPGEDLHLSGAVGSIASQLEERAPPGGILIGAETHGLVRDAVRAEQTGDAWRVDEVLAGAPAYARRLDAPLVGREQELGRLRSAYASVCDEKHCRVVTVVGEAGIGKTRLARELVSVVRDDAEVLVGHCASYGEGATYLPIAEIVRDAAEEESLGGVRMLLEGEADADAVAQRVAELTAISEAPAAPGEALWAVRRLLEAMARHGPLVIVFEDIHWAEPTLLDLIEYLGEWAGGPILVLCLARQELLEAHPGWGGPTSTGFLVELEPLSAETLGALVEQLAHKPIDPAVQERIVEHAGGNPLFAEQLVAAAAEAPEAALEQPPGTVEALLASRLDRLDPRELAVLRRAAVLGRRFTQPELADLAASDDLTRQLAGLTERGLVHPVDGLFGFHHVLLRDVAYRGIPKTDRAQLHELAASALDRRDGADELVGYHFEQAYRYLTELARADDHARELAQEGAKRLGRAGIRAWKRADLSAAVNLLSRSVDLAPSDELLCELGLALRGSGDLEGAESVFAEAARAKDEEISLRARIEASFQRSLVEPDCAGELLEVAAAAIPSLEEAADDRALGRAWLSIAHVRGGFYCEYASMEEAAKQAAICYGRSGWSPSSALDYLGIALYFGPRPVDEAVAQCQELLRAHEGDRASEANVEVWLGGLEAMRGNFLLARTHVARARSGYRDLGLEAGVTDVCGRVLAAIELLAGDPKQAAELLRESCAHLQRQHQTALLATRTAELAVALYEQERYEEAATWVRVARSSAGADDLDAALSRQPLEARLLARSGAVKKAERLARATVKLASRTDALNRHGDTLLALSEVLELAGRELDAQKALRSALALFEQKGNTVSMSRVSTQLAQATPAG
jgi:class 3 adenylate cyclase/tetratricopeptide (TPR) repeat protein